MKEPSGLNIDTDDILPLIPDPEFRQYLLEEFDKDGDGKISPEEALTVTRIGLSWSAEGVHSLSSMEGLQYFPNLEELVCCCNDEIPVTGFDVRHNPKLRWLECSEMQLEELDISCNPLLEFLDCPFNCLTELDVSNNPLLKHIGCESNVITELDVSNCPKLENLYCSFNKLRKLDVSHNPAIETLDCAYNELAELDLTNNHAIKELDCSDNPLTRLDVSHTDIGSNGDYEFALRCGLDERCGEETLKTVYLKRGWQINGVTYGRREHNISKETELVFVD